VAVYLFHIEEPHERILDEEGVELNNLAAVETYAVRCAGDLLADAVARGERDYQARLNVESDIGEPVLSLSCVCAINVRKTPSADAAP
jgi:hypothetical protein